MILIIQIQIPNSIIKNEEIVLDDKTFSLYVYLVYLEFRSKSEKGTYFKILHKELMHILNIGDNRTLKKCFLSLYESGLIEDKILNFPRNSIPINIKIKHKKDKYFTQLPSNVLYKIKDIGYTGIRLLYYYESYINRKNNKEFAYPSQETIAKDLKYSFTTIDKYNKTLVKYKLIKIVVHEFTLDRFDELDRPLFSRFNNHYYVRLDKF